MKSSLRQAAGGAGRGDIARHGAHGRVSYALEMRTETGAAGIYPDGTGEQSPKGTPQGLGLQQQACKQSCLTLLRQINSPLAGGR